ncbi:MAG: hypothetical protein IMY74_08555 [Bacteroidetes bacterium]|nr:hypothetical protein [Bacteroidota bacterium]
MKKSITYTILIFLIISFSHAGMLAQDSEPADIYMEFSTWKYNDLSRSLLAKITSDNDEGEYFVEGLSVQFRLTNGEEMLILGNAVSNTDGIAEFNIADGTIEYPKDEEGYIYFTASFDGSDAYWEAEEELMVKDVELSITFEEEGDDKLVYFEGVIFGPEEEWPLADDDLYFYIPRMFSDMKIADGWFEEDGTGYIDFPTTVIGDSAGNVLVIARLEDHYDYGNVEVSDMISWATPKRLIKAEGPVRELWTPIAPMWMIITLIIMLAGVWGHYIYAIVQLIGIRRSKN